MILLSHSRHAEEVAGKNIVNRTLHSEHVSIVRTMLSWQNFELPQAVAHFYHETPSNFSSDIDA